MRLPWGEVAIGDTEAGAERQSSLLHWPTLRCGLFCFWQANRHVTTATYLHLEQTPTMLC